MSRRSHNCAGNENNSQRQYISQQKPRGQIVGGVDQSSQNRALQKDRSNITCLTCWEMGHYTSFRDKQAPPPVRPHAGPLYASEALPANIISVLKDYSCPNLVIGTFSAGQFWEKLYKRVEETKKPELMFHIHNKRSIKVNWMIMKNLLLLTVWMGNVVPSSSWEITADSSAPKSQQSSYILHKHLNRQNARTYAAPRSPDG